MISDTGCGMEPAILDRVFDPFFTTKPPGAGTGLGLAVVHGVVKRHEGTISVYSEPGEGTTFNLYFPVHEIQKQTAVVGSIAIPRGKGERILFVDDEAPLATLGKSRRPTETQPLLLALTSDDTPRSQRLTPV